MMAGAGVAATQQARDGELAVRPSGSLRFRAARGGGPEFVLMADANQGYLFWQLIANRPGSRNGLYPIPQGPGFGVELDQDVIARLRA